jgi:hypothetical protein
MTKILMYRESALIMTDASNRKKVMSSSMAKEIMLAGVAAALRRGRAAPLACIP